MELNLLKRRSDFEWEIPRQGAMRVPAVIYCNGHWSGAKAEPVIQSCCLGLARMGVGAFCQDVIGTGERAAPPPSPHSTYHGNYRGAAPRIVDRSLLGYVMYECIRAMDYLETRPEIDAKRVMCTGASGGGKQSRQQSQSYQPPTPNPQDCRVCARRSRQAGGHASPKAHLPALIRQTDPALPVSTAAGCPADPKYTRPRHSQARR